jgi:hypothetical protein
MPKKKAEPTAAQTIQRFEAALRNALSTPPASPRKRKSKKPKGKQRRIGS